MTHKPCTHPGGDVYRRLWVGPGTVNGCDSDDARDSSGDNIAERNAYYAELTGLYWIWKNTLEEVVGLCHYRRYFCRPGRHREAMRSQRDVSSCAEAYDLVTAKAVNYFPCTIGRHYRVSHFGRDLDVAREVVARRHSDYLPAYDAVMAGFRICRYNMFIGRRAVVDRYCEWLFPVLEELYVRGIHKNRDGYQRRTIGFLGERLFNVWLAKASGDLVIGQLPIMETESVPMRKRARELIQRVYRHYVHGIPRQ